MEQRQKAISKSFLALVNTLMNGANKQAIAKAHSTGMRFIGGRINVPILQQSSIRHRILSSVTSIYSDKLQARTSLQVQQQMDKISRSKCISKRGQLLYLLLKISQSKRKKQQFVQPLFKQTFEKSTILSVDLNTTRGSIQLDKRDTAKIRQKGNPTAGISQENLLYDILYVLQNIQGHYIGIDQNGYFNVKRQYAISQSTRQICSQLCILASLYRSIIDITKSQVCSQTETAFRDAVQFQFIQYFRWIAIIQNLLKNNQLTLRRLVVWQQQPTQRLKWILYTCDGIKGYKGSNILSILNSFRPQGDCQINNLIQRLLTSSLKPFVKWIQKWILKGDLQDTYQQFFIGQRINCKDWQIWSQKYYLKTQLIPSIISYQLADIIVRAGKTLCFLRGYCSQQFKPSLTKLSHQQIINSTSSQSAKSLTEGFSQWIKTVAQQSSLHLIKTLKQKYYLLDHFQIIKRFLLMGQGDFIQALIQTCKQQLSLPHYNIYSHNLNPLLQGAIKSSNCQYLNPKLLSGVRAKVNDKSHDYTSGWDVFYLYYQVQSPINCILTPQAMQTYMNIFNFLWRVKLLQQWLSQLWKDNIRLSIQLPQALSKKFKICQLLRYAMSHFINTLLNYLLTAVQQHWTSFIRQLRNISNLQAALDSHRKLLKKILNQVLLSTDNRKVSNHLSRILKVIQAYRINQVNLNSNLSIQVNKMITLEKQRKAMRLLHKQQFVEDYGMDIQQDKFDKVGDLSKQFLELILDLTKLLKQENMKYLSFQLDFNQFYQNIQLLRKK